MLFISNTLFVLLNIATCFAEVHKMSLLRTSAIHVIYVGDKKLRRRSFIKYVTHYYVCDIETVDVMIRTTKL